MTETLEQSLRHIVEQMSLLEITTLIEFAQQTRQHKQEAVRDVLLAEFPERAATLGLSLEAFNQLARPRQKPEPTSSRPNIAAPPARNGPTEAAPPPGSVPSKPKGRNGQKSQIHRYCLSAEALRTAADARSNAWASRWQLGHRRARSASVVTRTPSSIGCGW
jgi:hypothetical protein